VGHPHHRGIIALKEMPLVEFLELEDHRVYINGYPGGTFRPSQAITREEVIEIVNKMRSRLPEELPDSLLSPYSDIVEQHKSNIHIMEASVAQPMTDF